jgi:hypothetical protein
VLSEEHASRRAPARRTPPLPLWSPRAPRRAGRGAGDHAGGRLRKEPKEPAARVTGVGRGQRPLRIWAHIRPDPFPIPSTSPASPVYVTVITYEPARLTRPGTRRGAKHQAPGEPTRAAGAGPSHATPARARSPQGSARPDKAPRAARRPPPSGSRRSSPGAGTASGAGEPDEPRHSRLLALPIALTPTASVRPPIVDWEPNH